MEVLHRGAMLVAMLTKEHCEKGMKVIGLYARRTGQSVSLLVFIVR